MLLAVDFHCSDDSEYCYVLTLLQWLCLINDVQMLLLLILAVATIIAVGTLVHLCASRRIAGRARATAGGAKAS